MINIKRKKKKLKKSINFKFNFININIFFIDKFFFLENILIKKNTNFLFFYNDYHKNKIINNKNLIIFYKKKNLLLSVNGKNKKVLLNLYLNLIKIKLKEFSQEFKLTLNIKGIGFKAFLKNKNELLLKLGFSHNISFLIPTKIKIIIQQNKILFISNDFQFLHNFVFFIKNFKKPEPFKGKGLFVNNEIINIKEGKKK